MIRVILLTLLVFPLTAYCQFSKATLGINGITCITCLHSTEKALLSLDFIDSVKIDGEKGTALLLFSENKIISFNQIANVINKAGFSLAYTHAVYIFKAHQTNTPLQYHNNLFYFLNDTNKVINGSVTLSLVNRQFTSGKEYVKWKKEIKMLREAHANTKKDLYFTAIIYN